MLCLNELSWLVARCCCWCGAMKQLKRNVKDDYAITHLLHFHSSLLSLFNACPRWHSRSFFVFFFILKSLNVCSTFLSTRTIKNTSSRSQLFFVQHLFHVKRCSGTNTHIHTYTHTWSSHRRASMRIVEHKKQNQTEFSFIYFAQNRMQQLARSARVNSCMCALKFGHYHYHSRCDFCDSDSNFHAVRKSNFSSVNFPSSISYYLDFDKRLCWFPKTEHTIIIWFAIERFVLSNFVHLIEHIWWTSRTFVQNMLFANCPIGYNFCHFSSLLSHSHSLSFIHSSIAIRCARNCERQFDWNRRRKHLR